MILQIKSIVDLKEFRQLLVFVAQLQKKQKKNNRLF